MSNAKILTDAESNAAMAESQNNRSCWWKWYNSLSTEQIYSHYTRHRGISIKQQYNEEVQQLPGVKQIMEERIEDEAQK